MVPSNCSSSLRKCDKLSTLVCGDHCRGSKSGDQTMKERTNYRLSSYLHFKNCLRPSREAVSNCEKVPFTMRKYAVATSPIRQSNNPYLLVRLQGTRVFFHYFIIMCLCTILIMFRPAAFRSTLEDKLATLIRTNNVLSHIDRKTFSTKTRARLYSPL